MAETKPKTLAQKLSAVMGGVGKLKKDGHNKFQNYDFISESNVVEAVRQLLVDNGVLAIPSVKYHWQESRQSKQGGTVMHSFVLLTYRFLDTESSEEITADWLGEGSDSGDKGFYKAYTGAQKYALMKTLLIPTGDDPENDGNAASEAPKQKQQPASTPAAKPSTPAPEVTHDTDETKKRAQLNDMRVWLLEMSDGDVEMFADLLEGYTAFTNDKGNRVGARRDLKKLSEGQIPITHHKVKEGYAAWKSITPDEPPLPPDDIQEEG